MGVIGCADAQVFTKVWATNREPLPLAQDLHEVMLELVDSLLFAQHFSIQHRWNILRSVVTHTTFDRNMHSASSFMNLQVILPMYALTCLLCPYINTA